MARNHGRILTAIWEDGDFLSLPPEQQRLYLFLISQPNLNHAGLLPLTLRRWARKAAGLTVPILRQQLAVLADRRFVVIDEDTEELLVRTLVRNDGVWKQPKVMAAMVAGAGEVSSPALRAVLLEEAQRLPLEELSDEPGSRGGRSVRRQIEDHLVALRRQFGVPQPPPPTRDEPRSDGDRKGTPGVSDTPSEGDPKPSETLAEGDAKPTETPGEGTTRADTRPRVPGRVRAPSPAPAPAPAPKERAREARATRPRPRVPHLHAIPDDFALTDPMRRWSVQTFGPSIDPDYETEQFVSHYRAEGTRKRSWPDAWQMWMRRAAKYASERQHQQPRLRAVGGTPEERGIF